MADPVPPVPPPDTNIILNSTGWYNLQSWAPNVTRYAPIFEDIVWAGPRIVKRLSSYITPDSLDSIPDSINSAIILNSDTNIRNIMEPIATAVNDAGTLGGSPDTVAQGSRLSVDGSRGFSSVFGYATSKWAIACIVMAIVLNRTRIFAATRRRLRLTWHARLLIRFLPILLLGVQARNLLQSIQCQTSPDFAELRWGDANKSSDLMFSQGSTFMNYLSSFLLFGATDEQSCRTIHMVPLYPSEPAQNLRGSLSRLWPLFGYFCLSHFFETLACAVQGRPVALETGMTLFEQSLAFAEADAAVSNELGWGLFSKGRPSNVSESTKTLSRAMILRRVNTPPEVLLVAFLSSMTHITSHLLGVFDRQAKYRLVTTGFWGLCFMACIVWSAISFDIDDPSLQGILRFPTVCIIGFVPHILIFFGIVICIFIYGFALLLSALSSPSNREMASMSFRQRLWHAHENMQANVSLSEIRITREMDFYTALLRTGFSAITMASEAVYLNEERGVSLKQRTWLEEQRLKEAEEMQRKWIGVGVPGSQYGQAGAVGLVPVKSRPTIASNGFARERAAQNVPKGRGERAVRAGVGAVERSSRWLMALEFLLSINKLLARLLAKGIMRCLRTLRIRYRPAWLLRLARHPKSIKSERGCSRTSHGRNRPNQTYVLSNGEPVPITDSIDVEAEFRRVDGMQDEETLEQDLYSYWIGGGWWGTGDSSGNFEPHPDEDDFDTTSVISMSTNADTEDEFGWESEDDGQRTPTQRSPQRSREDSPFIDSPMQMADLARLLHPSNPEEREEARTLAAHLQSDTIMTRSKFRRMEQLQRTRVLTSPRSGLLPIGDPGVVPSKLNTKHSPEEEERLLEQLLLSKRQASQSASAQDTSSWNEGGSGFGSGGPQCVVCQSAPRTVIVWPCRCLSLCDDCRVSLAMNNFDKCVCCRREVISFSRVFVP